MGRALASLVVSRPRLISYLSLLLALLCCWYSWKELRYSNDRAQMLSASDPDQAGYADYRREFPQGNLDVLVLVGGGEESERLRALESLSTFAAKNPQYFPACLYRVKVQNFQTAALYALSGEELNKIQNELTGALPLMNARQREGLGGLLHYLGSLQGAQLQALKPTLGPLLTRLRSSFERVTPTAAQDRPWGGPFRDGYLYLTLGSPPVANFLLVRLSSERDAAALDELKQEVEQARAQFAGLRFDLVGDYAVRSEDGRVARNSALGCSLISLILVKLLFLYTSAQRRRPTLALLALFSGLSWCLAWATWSVRELNLVSVNFAATMVGLGMDFSIHLLYRWEERLAIAPREAWADTFATSGKENLVGALATSAAFLSLCFTPFRGVQQLGWVSGSGILWIFVAMTLVYPALLQAFGMPDTRSAEPSYRRLGWLARLEHGWQESPRAVVALAAAATVLLGAGIPRLSFDNNLLHMSWNDSLGRKSEAAFRDYASTSCLFLVSVCDQDQLPARAQALSQLPGRVESLASLVAMCSPSPDQRRCVSDILSLAAQFPDSRPAQLYSSAQLLQMRDRIPADLKSLRRNLESLPDTAEMQADLDQIKKLSASVGPGAIQEALQSFEEAWLAEVRPRLDFLRGQRVEVPTLDGLPPLLLDRYRGISGRWLVKIYPRADIWDESELKAFVARARAVDPAITGQPILSQRYLELLNSGYRQASWTALGVIVVLLLLYFRNPWHAFLALLPKLLGLTWMLGILGWSGMRLNPANATALPLTLGVGLVFGVHILHCLIGKERQSGIFTGSTGAAVAVSGASTILGYAALTLAPHKGIASLGWVMIIGVSANLLAAIVVLPCFLMVVAGRPGPKGPALE